MEPAPGQIIAERLPKRMALTASRNNLEIFLHYPDMADQYYHYIITPQALSLTPRHGLNKRDIEYDSGVEYAVKICRTVDPGNAHSHGRIGMKCFDGATWKLNVARCRKVSKRVNCPAGAAALSRC